MSWQDTRDHLICRKTWREEGVEKEDDFRLFKAYAHFLIGRKRLYQRQGQGRKHKVNMGEEVRASNNMDIPWFQPALPSSNLSTMEYFPANLSILWTLIAKNRQAAPWMLLPQLHVAVQQLDVALSIHPLSNLHVFFKTSFMVPLIMDITLFILAQLLLLKGNYLKKAKLQEQQLPTWGTMVVVISSPITAGS